MFYPPLEEVKNLAQHYNLIPISAEINADMETPISVFKRLEDSKLCFMLESVEDGEKWGRYSFIGRDPFLTVKSKNGKSVLEYRDGKVENLEGNPVNILQQTMGKYKSPEAAEISQFNEFTGLNGGAVGFFGYDTVRFFEKISTNIPQDDLNLPESHFMLVDEVIAFDHLRQKMRIIVNMHVEGNVDRAYHSCIERIKEIRREIAEARWKVETQHLPKSYVIRDVQVESSISREAFCENVRKAKEDITNGEISQVVLSQRLCIETEFQPLNLYRSLRAVNPSPYMYLLKFEDYAVVGSSPEKLVKVSGERIETSPIAGTKKRGMTELEDKLLEKELLSDPKEIAEHMMLVDLARDDVGKVSRCGTVTVKDLMHIEKFSHVMHLVSTVEGTLKKGKTALNALGAVLPAGTLSGAPKVRAMEIIDELETVKRGIYGGAIGYLGFDGRMDTCIVIRTMVLKDKKAYIQAGAGIVADSVPEKEYDESMSKAMALIKAVKGACEYS